MKHHKLVRDRIPEIIVNNGGRATTRKLGDAEYKQELYRKLQEEVTEFFETGSYEELADILEVIYALGDDVGISQPQLEAIRTQKRDERGGFEQRIFLIEVV